MERKAQHSPLAINSGRTGASLKQKGEEVFRNPENARALCRVDLQIHIVVLFEHGCKRRHHFVNSRYVWLFKYPVTVMKLLQLKAGNSCVEGPVYTSELGEAYRSTLCSFHHGVGNNPLQAESVSHYGYLAVWCVSEQNKWGVLRVLGWVSERNDRNECEEKRRKPWQPSIHSNLVLDCGPFWLLCISTELSDSEA